VAPKPFRATAIEKFLEGQPLNAQRIAEVEAVIRSTISPIDDVRGSARYKMKLSVNATQAALERAVQQ
jgi:CO/xanthine dehydrogenase FAD-binding subunit